MSDNIKRYSDEELEEFRILINEKISKATEEYESLRQSMGDSEEPSDAVNNRNSFDDNLSRAERESLKQLADRQLQFIEKLKGALKRIDNKTYGICRVTGELIPKDRLRAVPHATLSIEAKKK